ncbi:MAG: LamG-like jellyroll fold domain-containing protein [Pseudomonadota bacterium]
MNSKKAYSLFETSLAIVILAIVIGGTIQGSRLVALYRLQTAQSLTQSSPVSAMKNLVTWLEATSETSLDDEEEIDGSKITNWYDLNQQTNVKNNAVNNSATVSDHPTYKSKCINNLPCLQFNGTSQYMDITQNAGYTNELTIFVVFLSSNDASDFHTIIGADGTWSSGISFRFKRSTAVNYQTPDFNNDTSTGALLANKNYIAAVVDGSSTITNYLNGTAGTTTTVLPANRLTKRLSALNIASSTMGTRSNFFDGNIGEIIIFDRALKNYERQNVEKYLSQKWQIPLS